MRWKEAHLYTELGEAVHDVESQVRVLVDGLIVPPDDDAAVLQSARQARADLMRLFEADEGQGAAALPRAAADPGHDEPAARG